MSVKIEQIPVCTCDRCGFTWIPKGARNKPFVKPVRCGSIKCMTHHWDDGKDRIEPVNPKKMGP